MNAALLKNFAIENDFKKMALLSSALLKDAHEYYKHDTEFTAILDGIISTSMKLEKNQLSIK